jgi:hypothetical protein
MGFQTKAISNKHADGKLLSFINKYVSPKSIIWDGWYTAGGMVEVLGTVGAVSREGLHPRKGPDCGLLECFLNPPECRKHLIFTSFHIKTTKRAALGAR